MTSPPLPDRIQATWRAAVEARTRAYCPYSEYQVGAALCFQDRIISGCNVENASYGGTICAERNAIWSAVAQLGAPLQASCMVLVTRDPAPPCGNCLQVIGQFFPGSFPIHLATPDGIYETCTLDDLLPRRFEL